MRLIDSIKRHPGRTASIAASLALLAGFALYWFSPHSLFFDRRVDEALPSAGAPVGEAPAEGDAAAQDQGSQQSGDANGDEATDDGAPDGPTPASEPVTLAEGAFRSLEHASSGTALLVELPDGSRYLRLQDLETSNGPDLRVVLTDQPLSEDWRVWDDGELIDLGGLKGNIGSSNYAIGSKVDLGTFRTAVVWCRRFSVGFAVAPLEPAT